jgi:DNA helicase II / ATP-dependent DNA helicase PcrA
MTLRKGQRELFEQYRGGYCAVPAIPGGGKTHCLSLWTAEIISLGLHKPGKILIVTYMNSAVNNLKQRISKELEQRDINGSNDYFVSTIHGLCLQIMKEKSDAVNINNEFEIADGASKTWLVNSSIEEWRSRNEDVFSQYLDDNYISGGKYEKTARDWQDRLCNIISAAIGDLKCRGISPWEAKERCKGLHKNSLLKHAADIYGLYDRKLKASGLIDFEDMLFNAKRLLSTDDKLLEKYRKKYTYVCEDEAQDSNHLQSEILSMIANGNFLRAGDSNQAICSTFTNSDFSLFKDFCELPQTTVYNIIQSSRSTRDIIDLANHFVNFVYEQHPVLLCRKSLLPQFIQPVGDGDEKMNPVTDEYGIKTAVFNSWEEEAQSVVNYSKLMMSKHPCKSIAILIPTSWKINDVIRILEARGIPYEELDNGSCGKTKPLRYMGRILDFLSQPDSNVKFINMIKDCFPISPGTAPLEATGNNENLLLNIMNTYTVFDLLYSEGGKPDTTKIDEELLNSATWKEFEGRIVLVRELLEFPYDRIEKLIMFLVEKLEFGRDEMAIAQKVAGDIKFIKARNPLWGLSELAAELLSTKSMFSYFAGMIWDLKGYEPKPGVVTVSTYHKSKGLEWDIVFLTSLSFSDFPVRLDDKFVGEYWFLKQEYKNPQALVKNDIEKITTGNITKDSVLAAKLETISERARLLYVGITRSKEYLFMSGFHYNPGKRGEVQPSAYLTVLKKYIDGRLA